MSVQPPVSVSFAFNGSVVPLAKGEALSGDYRPSRPLGGWLVTYGTINADGTVTPVVDRQGHTFDAAAKALGSIDWTQYLAKGLWNDTHLKDVASWADAGTKRSATIVDETPTHVRAQDPTNPEQVWELPHGSFAREKRRRVVGHGMRLEYHDATSPLAKAHGKVGFWTEGHLWDRNDPRSWTLAGAYEPTSADLDRADHFWALATMLKGVPRPIGFSADGKMLLSPCGTRIIWARVNESAVCELPQNPHAVALPLELSVPLGGASVLARACDTCRCPPGARCVPTAAALAKAVTPSAPPVPEDLEPDVHGDTGETTTLIRLIVDRYHVSEAHAKRWVTRYYRNRSETTSPEKNP